MPDTIDAERIGRHLDHIFGLAATRTGGEHNHRFTRFIIGEPHPLSNCAVVRDADALAEAAAPLLELGLPSAILARTTIDQQALGDLGYQLGETMPAMAVDLDALADTTLQDGDTFARLTDESLIDEWTDCLSAGYGLPRKTTELLSPIELGFDTADNADIRYYAAFRDGRIVGTSLMMLHDGLAGIYCVATLEDHRGRGIGAHTTAEPLRHARREGCTVGVLQSSNAGLPVYTRLGFEQYGPIPLYIRMPG